VAVELLLRELRFNEDLDHIEKDLFSFALIALNHDHIAQKLTNQGSYTQNKRV
jgi:hypothetical protein